MGTETWDEILTRVKSGQNFHSDWKRLYFTEGPLSHCLEVTFTDWFTPKKIIFNGPATIVFWNDGTKTIVKRSKKDKDNKYNAFCAALAKKIFKTNNKVNNIVMSGKEE